MAKSREVNIAINLISNEKIAETSSKGNQEKWFDSSTSTWYKLDQFGYEALAETLISILLEMSNIETDTAFTFVRYRIEKLNVRGNVRNGCTSRNFLQHGQSLITVNRLLTNHLGAPLKQKLMRLSSDKKRIAYLAEATADYTGLAEFPHYLTLLFEIDALFCNDDRHLNNIAVIGQGETYDYCPIFDNGAGLLSNTQLLRMDIMPKALLGALRASPLGTTFTRQMNSARGLYGKQLIMPTQSDEDIRSALEPLLTYYAERDRRLIADRVTKCILMRQKAL
jgi:hypothetical protein